VAGWQKNPENQVTSAGKQRFDADLGKVAQIETFEVFYYKREPNTGVYSFKRGRRSQIKIWHWDTTSRLKFASQRLSDMGLKSTTFVTDPARGSESWPSK
jgi:hypothetical protein